jgi:bifunctional UDP-N-acetylglucosamine pyrophosphorylase/glucosamine-1-phosphate N-acetyltransferase
MVDSLNAHVPVVILAGGRATRLQPFSNIYPKALTPIAGKPLIERIISSFKYEGFKTFIIVCSSTENYLKEYLKNSALKDSETQFVITEQKEPKGMINAIQCAQIPIKETLNNSLKQFQEMNLSPFFVLSAVDALLDQSDLSKYIQSHKISNPSCTMALYRSEDASMSETHGNVKMEENVVLDIIEKPGPDNKIDDFYSIPIYIFTLKLLEYINEVKLSSRNELELPSAIKLMLDKGLSVIGTELCQKYKITKESAGMFHLTNIPDILKFSFRFLNEARFEYTGEYPTLIEPAAAKSCEIGDSVLVGPNVYIDANCKIGDYSEISQSILLGNNTIGKNVTIENSIIGENIEISNGSTIKDTLIIEDNEPHKI